MLFSFLFRRRSKLPKVKHLIVSSAVVRQELADMGLRLMYPALLDEFQEYHHTDDAGWEKVAEYIYRTFKFPKYVPGRKDCDYFAILFMALVQTYFGFNGCGFVIGQSSMGNHAYNMVRSDGHWRLKEPNPNGRKEYFNVRNNHGYVPEDILI